MNGADTAFVMIASAFVLLMTLPGLALFYGGLVKSRNVLSVLIHCFTIACVVSVLWFIVGYSIAFGETGNGWWGGLDKALLAGVTAGSMHESIPEIVFFLFQMTFAIITPALIAGAYVERVGFGFVVLFSALWMLVVYAPVAHWVWGSGMLADGGLFGEVGAKDFSGGLVVHQTAGMAALVLALFLGRRKDNISPPHNPIFVMIGGSMLWIGWFGFNGGSELAANGAAGMAIVCTHLAAAASALTWALYERIRCGKTSLVGTVTGAVAGLVSVTPAAGYVEPSEALIIGAVAGVLCQEAITLIRSRLNIDDALDVFAVHCIGGAFGTIMIAVFGYGSYAAQVGSIAIVCGYTMVATAVLAVLVRFIVRMRVDEATENAGLDFRVHGERAYDYAS